MLQCRPRVSTSAGYNLALELQDPWGVPRSCDATFPIVPSPKVSDTIVELESATLSDENLSLRAIYVSSVSIDTNNILSENYLFSPGVQKLRTKLWKHRLRAVSAGPYAGGAREGKTEVIFLWFFQLFQFASVFFVAVFFLISNCLIWNEMSYKLGNIRLASYYTMSVASLIQDACISF